MDKITYTATPNFSVAGFAKPAQSTISAASLRQSIPAQPSTATGLRFADVMGHHREKGHHRY